MIPAAISAAARSCSAEGRIGSGKAASTACEGSGPGANRTFGTPRRSAISGALWASSNAHTESAVLTCNVPSRAIRAGHALRAIASPTASGQRSSTSPRPACGPKRDSSARTSLPSLSRGHLHDLRRLERERAPLGCGDHDLPQLGDARREHAAAAGIELREDVVEQQQRLAVQQLGLREEQERAPRGAARPASRSCAGRGSPPQRERRRGAGRARSRRGRCRRRAGLRARRPSAPRPRTRAGHRRGRARPLALRSPVRARRSSRAGAPSAAPPAPRRAPSRAQARRDRRNRVGSASAPRFAARAPLRSPGERRGERGAGGRRRGRSTRAGRRARP